MAGVAMSEELAKFQERVESLVAYVEGCARLCEWASKRHMKKLRDDCDGEVYVVPALILQRGPIQLILDPLGYDIPGAEGAADLYIMPAYDAMASFYFEDGSWNMHYVFPTDPYATESVIMPQVLALDPINISRVLDSIAEHAVL